MAAQKNESNVLSVDEGEKLQEKWSSMAQEVSKNLPSDESISVEGVSAATRNPLRVMSHSAPRAGDDLVDAAMKHVQQLRDVLGFAEGEPSEFMPDPTTQHAAGRSIVHLYQHVRGIPIAEMTRSVRFDAENRIMDVTGDNVSVAAEDVKTVPTLAAADAVMVAAEALANARTQPDEGAETRKDGWGQPLPRAADSIELDDFRPKAIASFALPNRPTVFEKGPFEDAITAELVFHTGSNGLQLAWRVGMTLPRYVDYAQILVAADESGEVLDIQQQSSGVAAQGRVFRVNPAHGPRELVRFPMDLADLPAQARDALPTGFPFDWVADDQTFGNNAVGVNANDNQALTGQRQPDGVVNFDPASDDGVQQQILNEFYFCNVMHDFLYLIGFDEASGNFQISNFGEGGAGNDPVLALAHPQPVRGTANMLTRPDGTFPIMNMGLPATGRHTAFDRDVVFHEFVHGLTNRLVGGRLNTNALRGHQSGGMGEGWGDFYALTFHNFSQDAEKTVIGDWFSGNPSGIRDFPYDSEYPNGFGDLGTGRFALFVDLDTGALVAPVHDIGEVWCATLMEMNRRIVTALGDKERGYQLSWALVTDGLKLTPSRPSFIQARDAILMALDGAHETMEITDDEFEPVRRAVWEAFARFGMGANSRSLFGDSLNNPSGILADDSLPPGI